MTTLVKNTCYYCKKKFENISQCSICHVVYYCGRKCQQLDWKDHKKICKIVKRNLQETPPETLEQFNENLTVIVTFPRRFYLNHKFLVCRRNNPNENLNFWENLRFKHIFERIEKLFLAYFRKNANDTSEKTLTEHSKIVALLSTAKMQVRTYEVCCLFDKKYKNSQVLDKVITQMKENFQPQAKTKLKYKIKKRDYSHVSKLLQLENKLVSCMQKYCFLGICVETFEMILKAHPLHEEMSSNKFMVTEDAYSYSLENMRITSLLSAALFFFMHNMTRNPVTKSINKLTHKRHKFFNKLAKSARKNNDQNTLLYIKYFQQTDLYCQIMQLYNSCAKNLPLESAFNLIEKNISIAQGYVPKLYKLVRLLQISALNCLQQRQENRFVEEIDMHETIKKLTICEEYIHGHLFQQNQKLLKFGEKKLPSQKEMVKRSQKAFTFLQKLEEGKTITPMTGKISKEKFIEIQKLFLKELENLVNQKNNFLPSVKETPSQPPQELTSPKKSPNPQKTQTSKFNYHERVLRWFTRPQDVFLNDINYQYVTTNKKHWIIKIHAFALAVDKIVKEHGLKTLWENKIRMQKDIEYSIMGSYTIEGKEHYGVFSFCFDPVTEVCYHRCFTEKPLQTAVREYFKNAKFELDFPPLNVSFKKVKKSKSNHFNDGSYVVKNPNPIIVEIRSKNNDDVIRLVKMF